MKHETHPLIQGTPAWNEHRATHFNASDAGAMLGLSSYKTRTKLLREKSSGLTEEVDEATQRRFLEGHEYEAIARPWAEEIIGEELYPVVVSADVDGLPLSASLDGTNMEEGKNFEHKSLNQVLAAALAEGIIPKEYKPQMEQGLLISGAERCLFMASNGNRDTMQYAWYESDPAVRAELLAGWRQFAIDLAEYQPVEVIPAAVATPQMALPALSIQVNGSITLTDNLKVFGERLESFIAAIDKNPSDDQAFADAEAAIKTLEKAQTALEAAEAGALAQTASIDEMRRTVALYAGQARSTRLMLEKVVKARKESIRVEIVQGGKDAFAAFVSDLNKQIGKPYLVCATPDFAGAIRGKKTVASLRDAVDTLLAQSKIAANEQAGKIIINMQSLRDLAKDHAFLFADAAQLVTKANDDLVALVKMRIAEHKAAEATKLEAERERIRAEEQAKAKAEQERDEAERVRQQAIRDQEDAQRAQERAKADAEALAKAEAQAKEDARLRPEREAEENAASTERMIEIVRQRIEGSKPHAGIARAIDAYLSKERKAA